jgi:Redoxin
VWPVSLDVDASEVTRFYREYGLTIPAYLDPGRNVASKFDILGTPETFLIDSEGKIAKYYLGPQEWSSPQMIARLEKMIPGEVGTDSEFCSSSESVPRIPTFWRALASRQVSSLPGEACRALRPAS